jgi:hypothetical protein
LRGRRKTREVSEKYGGRDCRREREKKRIREKNIDIGE